MQVPLVQGNLKMISRKLTNILLTVVCLNYSFANSVLSEETGSIASLRHQSNDSSVLLNEPLSGRKQVETKSESAIEIAAHALKLNSSFLFGKNYKTMLGKKTPAKLEMQNDSAESFDSSEDDESPKSDFAGLSLAHRQVDSSVSSLFPMRHANKNVYKVPRHGSKKTEQSPESSRLKSDEQYFQVFASLFDHYAWNIPSLETSLSQSQQCLKDVDDYLSQLKLSSDWATKMIDASGRYRGQFFFENDYWLGSKQFCQEISCDYKEVALEFFVVKARVNPFPAFNTTVSKSTRRSKSFSVFYSFLKKVDSLGERVCLILTANTYHHD